MGFDFAQVYVEHFEFVWRFAAHRGVPRAALDDVAQEVFLVVHRRATSFEGRSTLRTWIAGITFNLVRSYLRKFRNEEPFDQSAQIASLEPLPIELLEQKNAAKLVDCVLAKMTPLQRESFILCELEGFSPGEASEALGVNENTMRTRLRAARLAFETVTARLRLDQARSL